jgi:hypothetical protein
MGRAFICSPKLLDNHALSQTPESIETVTANSIFDPQTAARIGFPGVVDGHEASQSLASRSALVRSLAKTRHRGHMTRRHFNHLSLFPVSTGKMGPKTHGHNPHVCCVYTIAGWTKNPSCRRNRAKDYGSFPLGICQLF